MQHDGVHNGCEAQRGKLQLIMAPQLNAEASPMIWSNCSRESVTRFLEWVLGARQAGRAGWHWGEL